MPQFGKQRNKDFHENALLFERSGGKQDGDLQSNKLGYARASLRVGV